MILTCCKRHRTGLRLGACGETLTRHDAGFLALNARGLLADGHDPAFEDHAAILDAVLVLAEQLAELLRAVEKMDSAFVDADHYPAPVAACVATARGR